jgi:SAM-dependent methyltransferase
MQPVLYQQMRDIEDQHWWFQGRRKIVSALLSKLELPANSKMLDLGCGTGGNLQMLSGFGEVTGVEMDPAAAELARKRGLAPVLNGCLPDDLPLDECAFNCVTMLDVLEHIEQDEASLKTVNQLLMPSGQLLLTVPAFKFLWGPHDDSHHHKRRYRSASLRAVLQASGFTVTFMSYYNSWLFPPIALLRLLRKLFPAGDAELEATLPPLWMNRLLLTLFASERFVLSRARFPFGVSLLAVAQKVDPPH